jgi:hypothetical protein
MFLATDRLRLHVDPRLGFYGQFFLLFEACIPCNVKLRKHGGAFWGQSMTKVFEKTIEQDNPDLILTIDYDTVLTAWASLALIQTMMLYPESMRWLRYSLRDITRLRCSPWPAKPERTLRGASAHCASWRYDEGKDGALRSYAHQDGGHQENAKALVLLRSLLKAMGRRACR